MSETITLAPECGGRVLVVEFNRPRYRNALSLPMLERFAHILSAAHQCSRAVVLTGAGGAFCAGVDGLAVRDALAEGWGEKFQSLVAASQHALRALLDCPVPVIAAVDGPAAGAGVTYALVSDTRVMSERAVLRPGHLAAGVPLDGGASYALAWAFGPGRTMSLLLEDVALTGDELHRLGLSGPPQPSGEVRRRALQLAEMVIESDYTSAPAARRLLRRASMSSFDEQWAAEVSQLRAVVESGALKANLDRLWNSR